MMPSLNPAHVPLPDVALDQLFRTARSYYAWQDAPVSDAMLRQLYDLMKWAPTSANLSPVRLLFLRSEEAKRRLVPALSPKNVDKVMGAPVTAIVAYDLKFYDKQPKLLPYNPKMREMFAASPELVETTARRNSSLQGAYMMLAARALGLDCGPISGFDNKKVDDEFFGAGTPCDGCDEEFLPEGRIKSNFLCNLGYGDPAQLHERLPRLDFAEACKIL
jgi:3-hydroxypropanoate dehydrogenase